MSNTSPAAKKYKRLAVAALASALTFLVVAFLQIPFPIGQGGYINIGDAFIFLFATLLPFPYGIAAAAVGPALADVASGYAIYAPFTLLIKAAMAACFDSRRRGRGGRDSGRRLLSGRRHPHRQLCRAAGGGAVQPHTRRGQRGVVRGAVLYIGKKRVLRRSQGRAALTASGGG